MKAGRLRHRIRLEQATLAQDAYGATTKVWMAIAEVPADINYISGREFVMAERDAAENTVRIFIRNQPPLDIEPNMRAIDVDTNAEFDIRAVLRDHTRSLVTLVCRSGDSHS
jgi:head-tail adaptor